MEQAEGERDDAGPRPKEAAESAGSIYVEAGGFVRIGDRQRAGVRDALVRPVRVVELLELPQCVEEMPLVPDQGAASSSR
ncbi:hypothetical protein, partial [Streptomyces sp. NPDC006333]|uniref:hypothetical protein n=1 Tax=Streptomyces sp. NPDC006333 TaxID=3156753 RepID=UPI0033A63349